MKTKLFPTLIIDEFLDNPDKLVDYSKKLEYHYDEGYRWPGKRTRPLHEIDNDLFNFLGNKILTSYGFKRFKYNAIATFQVVNKNYQIGWIHRDNPMILTSIIYLNRQANINSGTSLYKAIENLEVIESKPIFEAKFNVFKKMIENENYILTEKDKNVLKYLQNMFKESLNIKNFYNRMFSFESDIWHSANEYDCATTEPRLTLVYFFKHIDIET